MEKRTSIEEFYKEISKVKGQDICHFLPPDISKDIGHFNVFDISESIKESKKTQLMPYNKRMYYKISIIKGHNLAEYADKSFEIKKNALLFATPKIPYHWLPQDDHQSGFFCVFTDDFLIKSNSGVVLDDLPIFQKGVYPIFEINEKNTEEVLEIFVKMQKELHSDYIYKYDLIRNYLLELIHFGQKLQPVNEQKTFHNAATRVTSLFIELLERQFPIESPQQRLNLRTAKDFADRLSIHINHLNKVLKETLGRTTTEIIANRIAQESKLLLKQTNWNVSEIAYSLGFEEVAHFSNFFKKHTQMTPILYRS